MSLLMPCTVDRQASVQDINTTQHNTTQHNTTQHNTTQHNTTQHNTTQHNTMHQEGVYSSGIHLHLSNNCSTSHLFSNSHSGSFQMYMQSSCCYEGKLCALMQDERKVNKAHQVPPQDQVCQQLHLQLQLDVLHSSGTPCQQTYICLAHLFSRSLT